jgi:hypothetical protein
LCGADLKFGQFLKNIVQTVQLNNTLDCHVNTFDARDTCAMNYTFIGKMETFKEDTFHILSKCNQKETLAIFEKQFSSLHADDLIGDSITIVHLVGRMKYENVFHVPRLYKEYIENYR